jgi:gas vesicle protein
VFSTARIAIVGSVIVALLGALWYVSGLRADLERSQQNVRTLKDSIEQQAEVIDRIQQDQREIIDARNDLRRIVRDQNQEIEDLRSRFNESADGSERDLGRIALEKPGLVENIVNDGSADAIRCMELASGAEPTQEEIDANVFADCNLSSSP